MYEQLNTELYALELEIQQKEEKLFSMHASLPAFLKEQAK